MLNRRQMLKASAVAMAGLTVGGKLPPSSSLLLADEKKVVPPPDDDVFYTGLGSLDASFGGFRRKRLGIVIGHRSSGKTSVLLQTAIHNTFLGRKVVYFSQEANDCNTLINWFAYKTNNSKKKEYWHFRKLLGLDNFGETYYFLALCCTKNGLLPNLLCTSMAEAAWGGMKFKCHNNNDPWYPDLVIIDNDNPPCEFTSSVSRTHYYRQLFSHAFLSNRAIIASLQTLQTCRDCDHYGSQSPIHAVSYLADTVLLTRKYNQFINVSIAKAKARQSKPLGFDYLRGKGLMIEAAYWRRSSSTNKDYDGGYNG